jgi:hypothetical protein
VQFALVFYSARHRVNNLYRRCWPYLHLGHPPIWLYWEPDFYQVRLIFPFLSTYSVIYFGSLRGIPALSHFDMSNLQPLTLFPFWCSIL